MLKHRSKQRRSQLMADAKDIVREYFHTKRLIEVVFD